MFKKACLVKEAMEHKLESLKKTPKKLPKKLYNKH
jgi:hypothetical protein